MKFKFRNKVIRTDDNGTTTLAEGHGEREAPSWADVEAAYMRDIKLIFPQEAYASIEYFITQVVD